MARAERERSQVIYENQFIATIKAFEGNQPNPGDVGAVNGTEAEQRRAASLRALPHGYTKEGDPSHPWKQENFAEKNRLEICKINEYYQRKLIATLEFTQEKKTGDVVGADENEEGAGPRNATQ